MSRYRVVNDGGNFESPDAGRRSKRMDFYRERMRAVHSRSKSSAYHRIDPVGDVCMLCRCEWRPIFQIQIDIAACRESCACHQMTSVGRVVGFNTSPSSSLGSRSYSAYREVRCVRRHRGCGQQGSRWRAGECRRMGRRAETLILQADRVIRCPAWHRLMQVIGASWRLIAHPRQPSLRQPRPSSLLETHRLQLLTQARWPQWYKTAQFD